MSLGKYLVYSSILSTYAVFIWGAYLTGSGYGAACGLGGGSFISSSWPFCNGSLAFPSSWPAQVEYIHRALSILASVLLLASLILVWRMKPQPTAPARALLLSFGLLMVELFLGGLVIYTGLNVVYGSVSLATATAALCVMVIAGDRMYLRDKDLAGAKARGS